MPYSGIPKSKTKLMEKCVKDVMSQGHDKSSAIAICHNSIMGKAVEGGEKNMTSEEKKTIDKMSSEMKSCVMGHMKEGKSAKESMSMCQKEMNNKSASENEQETLKGGDKKMAKKTVKKQDEEEVKDEEVKEEVAEEVEEKADEEAVSEEKEEEVAEEAEEVKEEATEEAAEESEEADEEVKEESAEEEVKESDKVTDLVKQVLDKISEMEATLKKQDDPEEESASTEGAASEEAAPEESTPEGGTVEDVAPEGASPEGAEEISKVYDVVKGVPGQIEKLEKAFNDRLDTLEDRINKIEEQPAPSKVVSPRVVSKGDVVVNPNQEELDAINKELSELEEMKKSDLNKFQKERKWERALDLIEKRDQLKRTEA